MLSCQYIQTSVVSSTLNLCQKELEQFRWQKQTQPCTCTNEVTGEYK